MTTNELTISLVSDAAALDALAPDWDSLVLAAARPSPFMLHSWVSAWWRHFGSDAELAVVVARRGASVVGIAPLYIQRQRGLRVCRLLGGHESALGDLLIAQDSDGVIARALLQRISQLPLHYFDAFGVPAGGYLTRLATDEQLTDIERVVAPVLKMPNGWDAAYASRTSAKKRALHRRRLRQLSDAGKLKWTMARAPGDVEDELEHAFEIHARRWQGRPDGSTFGLTSAHDFHRDAARALAARDAVRILTLRIDERPVAFHYWFVLGTTMYVHRLAFDPALARFSPGQVTLLRALADASSEGVRRVEFLGGNERYKVELADGYEPLHQVIGLPQGLLAHVATRALLLSINTRLRLKQNAMLHHLYLDGLAPLRRAFGRLTANEAH